MLIYAKTVKYKAQCFSWQNEITNSWSFYFISYINFLIITVSKLFF